MKPLVEILREQGNTTDKITAHQYGYFYAEIFAPNRKLITSVLEIGIGLGGSIRAWEEYFPNATIYGIDIREEFVNATKGERIETVKIDARVGYTLNEWAQDKEFDIVIDDGSHKAQDIDAAYYVLWQFVTPGGLYIIEDVGNSPEGDQIMTIFELIAESVILNNHSVKSVMFRPNMIVLEKKRENDMTVPPLHTL